MTDRAFGGLLSAARKQRAWSQATLALEAGVDASYISKLEDSHREPSRETVGMFCDVLNLTVAEENRMYVAAGYVPPGCWVVLDEWLIKADEAITVGE
jgi:transcriptional regulator with XRE-family HTH domain